VLNVGTAEPLVKFPYTLFAVCAIDANVNAGVVVGFETFTLNNGDRLLLLTIVTEPVPLPPLAQATKLVPLKI
jgi:hypothetical protein